ncbi:uncharacterized protein LOC124898582 [Capsicum annuum]|uniref:uncharacterized protein LOC124898582 n=1 Tax=Capsicum annuum TaxID=4072 RepID=UPI001FB0D3E5|nr:uncharacterized protein LOC124898582 [Capsicum annuum]
MSTKRGESSNFVEQNEEETSLLLVTKKEIIRNKWYLDTECNNHMTGVKEAFSTLDGTFIVKIRFGDDSKLPGMGKGQVKVQTKRNEVHIISNVLYVPRLKTNLLSIGQSQEEGYELNIKDGKCKIQDANLGLFAQESMMKEFDMSDLGRMQYFPGLVVVQSSAGFFVSQKKYAKDLLLKFQMERCNRICTPVDPSLKLDKDPEGQVVDETYYKQLVGSLMYLTTTRPDIMYVVNLISRYIDNPKQSQLLAVKRILRYL